MDAVEDEVILGIILRPVHQEPGYGAEEAVFYGLALPFLKGGADLHIGPGGVHRPGSVIQNLPEHTAWFAAEIAFRMISELAVLGGGFLQEIAAPARVALVSTKGKSLSAILEGSGLHGRIRNQAVRREHHVRPQHKIFHRGLIQGPVAAAGGRYQQPCQQGRSKKDSMNEHNPKIRIFRQ